MRSFLRLATAGLQESFLDEILRAQFPELCLDRCMGCGSLWSVDARQDQSLLVEAYGRIPDAYFGEQTFDPRFVRLYRGLDGMIEEYVSGRRLLDVGCGDGAFLAALSEKWQKSGIEPSNSGMVAARRRGLEVHCGVLDTCPLPEKVDVITALDVIEHVVRPDEFLASARARLASGGILLLMTGDATSTPSRVAGDRWSYIRWCGHVSVLSASALRLLLQKQGYELLEFRRCNHPASPGAKAWWRVLLLQAARRVMGMGRSWYPFWMDHQIVVARLRA